VPAANPPFLSVVVHADGDRPWLLHDTLLALAAQTDDQLEVLLLAGADPDGGGELLQELVGAFADDFRARLRPIAGAAQGGDRLVDVVVAVARSGYLAVLAEGEVPLGHWAADLRRAATAEPGRIVHGAVAEQRVAPEAWQGRRGYAAAGPVTSPEDLRFDLIEHLGQLATFAASGGVAVPRELLATLSPPEDGPGWDAWAVLLRAALRHGVASTDSVIALRRHWNGDGRPGGPTAARRAALLATLDAERLTVPPGLLQRAQRLAGEQDQLRARAAALQQAQVEAAAARRREEQLRRERDDAVRTAAAAVRAVEELYRSTSWRLTKPVRVAGGLARRLGRRAARS
jgi:hypothetical protein